MPFWKWKTLETAVLRMAPTDRLLRSENNLISKRIKNTPPWQIALEYSRFWTL